MLRLLLPRQAPRQPPVKHHQPLSKPRFLPPIRRWRRPDRSEDALYPLEREYDFFLRRSEHVRLAKV